MPTTVTLQDIPYSKTRVLDATQTRLFLNELARVRGPWPLALIKERIAEALTRPSASEPRIQPDCRIMVSTGSTVDEYELLSETVLRRVGNRSGLQFYFGLLLVRWLNEP